MQRLIYLGIAILLNDYAFSSENVIVVVSTQAVRNQSNIWDSQNQRLKR